jgi:hypothetical protein
MVTRASNQLYEKAMTIDAIIIAVNSIRMPTFSEMPSCSVLAVVVSVVAAEPDGIESRTWMDWAKRAFK